MTGVFHKTGKNQPIWLFLSQPDMVLLQSYQELAERYLTKQYIEVNKDTPLFVNSIGGPYVGSKKNCVNFGNFLKIVKIPRCTFYTIRKMFITWQWSQSSAILKECASFAAGHSQFVAVKHYVSDATKRLKSATSHAAFWSALNLSENNVSHSVDYNVKVSNKQEERFETINKEMLESKLNEYLDVHVDRDEHVKPELLRVITPKAKAAFIEMIANSSENNIFITNRGDPVDIFLTEGPKVNIPN